MPEVTFISLSERAWSPAFGGSGMILALAMAMLVLLLAVEALITAARVLLEPMFALIRMLFWLVFLLATAAVALLMLASGSPHGG